MSTARIPSHLFDDRARANANLVEAAVAALKQVDEETRVISEQERIAHFAGLIADQMSADQREPLNHEKQQLQSIVNEMAKYDRNRSGASSSNGRNSDTVASSDDKESDRDQDKDKTQEIKKNDPPAADPSDQDDYPARGRFDSFTLLPLWMQLVILFLVFAFVTPWPWTGWAISIMRWFTNLPLMAWVPYNSVADNIITFLGVVALGFLLGFILTKLANAILDRRRNDR